MVKVSTKKRLRMKCLLLFIFVILSLDVFAFNNYKINNTFIKIDYKLNDSEILDFVDNFDLTNLNSIYFLNMDKFYTTNYDNGGYYQGIINGIYYPNFKQIVIYRMNKPIEIRGDTWRETFCHEYGHYIGLTKYKDLSEKFAYYHCYDREYLGLGDKN